MFTTDKPQHWTVETRDALALSEHVAALMCERQLATMKVTLAKGQLTVTVEAKR